MNINIIKQLLKSSALSSVILTVIAVSGCASFPDKEGKIHLILEKEAVQHRCKKLDYAGSASAILINGKKRNTAVIVKKALATKGATHISYTKGEAGYAFTKANIWACPNPNMTSSDPETLKTAREYIGHE